jgi:dihydrofolate reductase
MEAIYATDIYNGLSKDGFIPWKSKKDMKFFMDKTKNNVVIMGRKTYFSIPEEYRPLKDRLNIILTSNPKQLSNEFNENLKEGQSVKVIFTDNTNIYYHILKNRENYKAIFPYLNSDFKIFIIGGKNIYEQFIPLCDKVWVTRIKKDYSCDLFLNYDFSKEFKENVVDEDDVLKIFEYKKIIN